MSLQNKQIDYSVQQMPVIPVYKFSKLYQQTGGQRVNIVTGNSESIFELPARVMNFSRSVLRYTSTPQAGANTYDRNWMFADVMSHIRQIQVYTRGGTYLCDINNVDKMSSVTLKAETKLEDSEVVDVGTAGELDDTFGATRSTELNVTTETQTAATTPDVNTFGGYVGDLVTSVSDYGNPRYGGENATTNAHEPKYLKSGVGQAQTPVMNMNVPLSKFKNSILSIDKDFFFNEVVLLKITWNDIQSFGFSSEDSFDPSAGTLRDLVINAGNGVVLSNLALYLAIEHNPVITTGLIQTVMAGQFVTNIPYVYQFKHSGNATTSQNITLRLNRAHGKFLKKIYHILYDPTEASATRYLHSNLGRDIVTRYHTEVDNVRRQEFDVTIADNDDWVIHKDALKGTLLNRMETYRYNWFILDKFDDEICKSEDGCVDSGMSLDFERKWDLLASTSAVAHNHYTFAVVSRSMAITPAGVFVQ
jgi:hypothetical protein